jgi:hypothetical protein
MLSRATRWYISSPYMHQVLYTPSIIFMLLLWRYVSARDIVGTDWSEIWARIYRLLWIPEE